MLDKRFTLYTCLLEFPILMLVYVGIVSDQGSGHSNATSDEGSVVLVLDLSLRLVTSWSMERLSYIVTYYAHMTHTNHSRLVAGVWAFALLLQIWIPQRIRLELLSPDMLSQHYYCEATCKNLGYCLDMSRPTFTELQSLAFFCKGFRHRWMATWRPYRRRRHQSIGGLQMADIAECNVAVETSW